ncbi:zinc ABC transporter substrate-binding protein [Streptomyces sp. AJS327]|uniref:metal ABC transporter substrate-binding protein n=1 Tax=Streptomyces sp. AJS327 TaxID=2545265 RepID=UPI0017B8E7D4|nr:metal ABC transporter substrate-binding protein [Streptomyces sp. AJS327]MBA0049915.1 zinc ABC transporter substrate-binding protein [Streptomyces sp. AJS327]
MNIRRHLIRPAAAATALGLGVLTLSACGDGPGGDDGKVSVVASFYPMEFLAHEIGGEHVSVSTLTKPGEEPHDLELSPKQTGQLSEADLVVYLKGLQPAVDEAVEQSGAEHTAEATSFTSRTDGDPKHSDDHDDSADHEDSDKGHDHGEHEHGDHGGDEHGDHDHAHDGGADDPHIWLNPVRYAEVAKGVGKELAKADPDHADDYRANTAALVKRLNQLDKDIEKGLKDRTSDTFITTHAAFGHFADRYHLREEAVSGLDPESEPSPARMKELHRIAKGGKKGGDGGDGVDTVFFASGASDRTARTLADDLGLKTAVLNPLEGVNKEKKQDYLSVMRQNLMALQTALGAR